ncbi:ATM interactor [Pleurodeles waltl]|uniref:ATM interactor n=1 Tax=Pleurodeles waltl TaxID=8319 RepID=UPI003709B1FE
MAAACVPTTKRASKSGSPRVRADFSCEHWEIVKPSVTDLTREGRSNILCTVKGCGKVLSNPPALNMHLVKSHGVQEGLINPTVRKVLKPHSQRLYCCPIEGCPRGPNRPFSQFSLVKQHFMKMHAEKKYKCEKCNNSYSTEGDLKRHAICCGKTFQCTCGCPYASRTALLSHIYRTGHEIPDEHRDPPVKKRKMEEFMQSYNISDKQSELFNQEVLHNDVAQKYSSPSFTPLVTFSDLSSTCVIEQALGQSQRTQKFLLPKPNIRLVQLPVMQFALFPTLPSADCSFASPVHLLPRSVNSSPNAKTFVLKGTLPFSKIVPSSSETVIGTVQTSIGSTLSSSVVHGAGQSGSKARFISSNAQTDLSCISQVLVPTGSWNFTESSCSQTDLSFGAPVLLPVSVESQTLGSDSKGSSSMATQTGHFGDSFSPSSISKETQTSGTIPSADSREQMDQAVMCNDIFNIVSSSYTAATQTSFSQETLSAENVDQRFLQSNLFRDVSSCTVKSETSLTENRLIGVNVDQNFLETSEIREVDSHNVKSEPFINFTAQKDALPQQNMTDSQTQTMDLLSDLENILSDNLSNQTLDNRSLLSEANAAGEMHLSSGSAPHGGIDFDIEEFFSASNIQTQTDESDLGNVNAESLDIETQTDFFSSSSTLRGNANFLAMFDTQTQTDLNFFLDHSAPLPIGNILKEASFSVSTDSSDNETQTDLTSAGKLASTLSLENQVQLNSAETQTIDSCLDTLGSLFLTSNETQTAMDDFLLADLAWNTMESQFSSVETQTCKELLSLFQTSDNLGD